MRQFELSELKRYLTALCDLCGIVGGFGTLRKKRAHFLFAFQIELIRFKPQGVIVAEGALRLYADQHILNMAVLMSDIVAVVCHRKGYLTFFCKRNEHLCDPFFFR